MTTAETPFVFVGSAEGDVRAFSMSEVDGSLTRAGSHDIGSLGFFAVGYGSTASERTLFVSRNNSVATLVYDAQSGAFTLGPTGSTGGGGTHIIVDSSGSSVFVAHYSEHALSHLTFSGSDFGKEVLLTPGENAHQVRERGGKVYVPCLGSNHIAQYALSGSDLQPLTTRAASAAGGPRHMDFHPMADVAYVLSELSSEIHVYDIGASGELSLRAGSSVFTHEDGQYHWSSDIKVHPGGTHLYAVNRDPSEIVHCQIGTDYKVTRGASFAIDGEVRSFAMDPKGAFLQVGSKTGALQTFAVDVGTGALTVGPVLTNLGTILHSEIVYVELP